MNNPLKYILLVLLVLLFNGCDLINPKGEEPDPDGEVWNHPNYVLTAVGDLVSLLNDSTYYLNTDENGDAKVELTLKFKYSNKGAYYYYWDLFSSSGYATLKSKKIYSSLKNTLSVYSTTDSSIVLVMSGIKYNNSSYLAYKYFITN